MFNYFKKILQAVLLTCCFTLLAGFGGTTTLDYTRKAETPADMPKGNPDPTLGIVVRPHSTGKDVLADSSQNIKFTVYMNFAETEIAKLDSSSRFEYTPKKLKFLDEKHGFSSDNIYEVMMMFDHKNHQWKYIQFMPFPSTIEWVTKEKLIEYLTNWVNTFEKTGWKRKEYPKSDDPKRIQNFALPTPEYNYPRRYCSWDTNDYEAVIEVSLRNKKFYPSYAPKEERKNITFTPDGYIAFITIYKKSQYSSND